MFALAPLAVPCILVAAATSPAAAGIDEATATARFLAQSPHVAAVHAGVKAARAELVAAGIWPNPSLEAERDQIFSTGGPTEQSRLGIRVPVRLAGKRELQRAIAEAGLAAAEARARHQTFQLAQDFRSSFAAACRLEARARALDEALATFKRLEAVAQTRARAGEGAGYDVLRLQLELTELETRRAEVASEAASTRAHLAGMLGEPLTGPLTLTRPGPLPDGAALLERARAQRADLAMIQGEAEQARLAADLAGRARIPDPELALGLRQTNEPTVQGLGYTAGLLWPMPLFERGQGDVARAEAELAQHEADRSALETRLALELPAARAALADRLEAAARFRRAVLARVPEVVRVAELAYREGDQGLVSLLDAHRAALEARLRALDLEAAAHAARLELERLAGGPLTDSPRRPE